MKKLINSSFSRNFQLKLLQMIALSCFVAMTLPYPALPVMFLHGSYSGYFSVKTMISCLMGAYPLGVFFGAIIIGRIIDQYPERAILMITLSLATVAQFISAYLTFKHHYNWLLLSRFISGLFEGNIVIVRSVAAKVFTDEISRKKAFSQINSAITLGWIIGPAVGGLIAMHSYMATFLSSALMTAIVLISVSLWFKNISSKIVQICRETVEYPFIHYKTYLSLLLLVSFLITMGIDSFYQFIAIYLSGNYQLNAEHIGYAAMLVASTNALTNMYITPYLHHKLSTQHAIFIMPILLIASFILLAIIHSIVITYVLLALVGSFIALTVTNIGVFISFMRSFKVQGKLAGYLLSSRTLGAATVSFFLIPALNYSFILPFLFGAVFLFSGWILFLLVTRMSASSLQ